MQSIRLQHITTHHNTVHSTQYTEHSTSCSHKDTNDFKRYKLTNDTNPKYSPSHVSANYSKRKYPKKLRINGWLKDKSKVESSGNANASS